jgi:hypothetical protein
MAVFATRPARPGNCPQTRCHTCAHAAMHTRVSARMFRTHPAFQLRHVLDAGAPRCHQPVKRGRTRGVKRGRGAPVQEHAGYCRRQAVGGMLPLLPSTPSTGYALPNCIRTRTSAATGRGTSRPRRGDVGERLGERRRRGKHAPAM